jgi:hypothetical protein
MRMTEKPSRFTANPPSASAAGNPYATPKASAALAAVAPPGPPPAPAFAAQSHLRFPPSAPKSNNPFVPYHPSHQQQEQSSPMHAGSLSTSTSSSHGIPNPFSSPSPSRSPSNATATTTATHHAPSSSATSIDPTTLASFPAIQYANQYANAHFSISDYTDSDPSSPPANFESTHYLHPPHTASTTGYLSTSGPRTPLNIIVPPAPSTQAAADKPLARDARAREMRGLADLISALDAAPSSAPSSWIAPSEGPDRGSSRLSRGEGVVTPIDGAREGPTVAKAHTMPTPTSPLPPSESFGRSKGGRTANPFEG